MATNFLQASGTNGFIATPFNLMSTELNTLANNSSAVSSVGGSSGIFTLANFANAIWCEIYFTFGGACTPVAPNAIYGWFLFSPDGGTTFETTAANTDLPRAPDFIIPILISAYATGNIAQASGLVRVQAGSSKVFINSHVGASLPSSGNLIKAAPVAIQY